MNINKENIKLSVIDIERNFKYDYFENIYGTEGMVSYGEDNLAPNLFNNCYKNSATLKSIIDGSVNYVLGDNIECNVASISEQVNRNGMTIRQFIANIAMSYLKFGGFAIQVIYSKAGIPVELYPLDFARCRTNEKGTKIYYNKKWGKYTTKSDVYDRFDPKNIDWKKPTQIFYFKGDFTNNVYPLPPYFASIKDILTEIECSKYSLNTVAKGFSARYIFNFPSVNNLTDEQKENIETAIKNKFCGSDTDANFMLYWQDGDEKMEVTKIEQDDAPEKFIAIKDNCRENIFIAMRATPNLFGLPTKTTGFNSQEYASCLKLYLKSVINPIQDIITEVLNKVFNTKNSVKFIPFSINFENN